MSGCGEAVDSAYSESSETQNVPTLHLVVDSLKYQESSLFETFQSYYGVYRSIERFYDVFGMATVRKEDDDDVARMVFLSCHVQSDRPVEYDTFVLVDVERLKHKNGRMDTTELYRASVNIALFFCATIKL